MKNKKIIISILVILILIISSVSAEAVGIPAICTGVLKAFALYGTVENIEIESSFVYNEETEKYDITLNAQTTGLTDGTELTVEIEGYTMDNEVIGNGLAYTVNGNTINSNTATIVINLTKPTEVLRKVKIKLTGTNETVSAVGQTEVKFILVPKITVGEPTLEYQNMPTDVIQKIILPVTTEDIPEQTQLNVKLVKEGMDINTSKFSVTGATTNAEGSATVVISAGPEITVGTYTAVVEYNQTVGESIEKIQGQKEFTITNLEINKIIINQTAMVMEKDERTILTYSIVPSSFTDEDVQFTSENPEVATFTKGGLLTAVARGETTVKITSLDGKREATCQVTVLEPQIEITQLSTEPEKLLQGEDGTIKVDISALDFQNGKSLDVAIYKNEKDVTGMFTIEGNSIQNDTVNLVITPNKETVQSGEYKVQVTYDGKQIESENMAKQIKAFTIHTNTPITGFEIEKTKIRMTVGATRKINATITPENAQNPKLIYQTDTPEVATVDENGEVEAIAKGKAKITITSDEDSTLQKTVEVVVADLLETEEYVLDLENKILKAVPTNTTVDFLLKNLQIASEKYSIMNKENQTITGEALVGTDMKLSIDGEIFKIIVIGDINGDGQITSTDLSKLKLHMVELEKLTESPLMASDINQDNQTTLTDLSKMKEYLVGI